MAHPKGFCAGAPEIAQFEGRGLANALFGRCSKGLLGKRRRACPRQAWLLSHEKPRDSKEPEKLLPPAQRLVAQREGVRDLRTYDVRNEIKEKFWPDAANKSGNPNSLVPNSAKCFDHLLETMSSGPKKQGFTSLCLTVVWYTIVPGGEEVQLILYAVPTIG